MSERWLGVACYFPRVNVEPIDWLISRGERIAPGREVLNLGVGRAVLPLRFGGLDSEAYCLESGHHRVLLVRFLESAYLDLVKSSVAVPPAAPLIEDFIHICDALEPDFAIIETALHPSLESYVTELERLVAEGNVERILETKPGCAYLPESAGGSDRLWEYRWPVQDTRTGAVAVTGSPRSFWIGSSAAKTNSG